MVNGYVVAAFYAAIILGLYYYRNHFEFEGIVALYRTEWGLSLMDRCARTAPGTLRALSIIGIGMGYVFMLAMLAVIWISIENLVYRPDAPAAFTPILPGVDIPGSSISFPLVEPLIAIFITVAVHEFSHGVIARLYEIDVESSGFVLLGPIPGAFVEPDEDQLESASQEASQGMFAAGPWSNILLAIPVFFIVAAGIGAADVAYDGAGVKVADITAANDTRLDGLEEDDVVTTVGNTSVRERPDLIRSLRNTSPNQTIRIETRGSVHNVKLTEPPGGGDYGFLGIRASTAWQPTETRYGNAISAVAPAYFWFFGDFRGYLTTPYAWPVVNIFSDGFTGQAGLLGWLFIITTGIAGANLLPIGPLDGGRMMLKSLRGVFDDETAQSIMSVVTWTLLIVVLALVFVPMIRPFL